MLPSAALNLERLLSLLRTGVLSAGELRSRLAMSPAAFSRLISAAGDQVCRMGRGRAIKYGRLRTIMNLGSRLPIFRVGVAGEVSGAGELYLLSEGQHWWDRPAPGRVFAGLPPALADMAPQGYLGQGFSSRFPELQLPSRLSVWTDDHRLIALARRGEDCVGDLIVGDESLQRFLNWSPAEVTDREYPNRARSAASAIQGSSAGGEFPKFGAFRNGRHVLVKFSSAEDSAAQRRWRDLLWCEFLALGLLAEAGRPAVHVENLETDGWRFLEVERFDRVHERGRRPVLTLSAIDNEYFGTSGTWSALVPKLVTAPFLLSPADAAHVLWLDAFGQLIGNTDRHLGNLAFFVDPDETLRLAPAYDMLPMILAPGGDLLVAREFKPAPPTTHNLSIWPDAAIWATRYWQRVQSHSALQSDVRSYAGEAAAAITELASRVSPSQETAHAEQVHPGPAAAALSRVPS